MNKKLIVLCLLLIAVNPVSASWTATATIVQSNGFSARSVAGKFNNTSSYLEITVTLVDNDHITNPNYYESPPQLKFASANNIGSLSFSIVTTSLSGCTNDGSSGTDNIRAHPDNTFGTQNADNTYSMTYRLYYACLLILDASIDGKHVDFQVYSPDGPESGDILDISFDGSATLYVDRTNPSISSDEGWLSLSSPNNQDWIAPSASNNTQFYFNGDTPLDDIADDNVEIGFKPSELLGESAGNFTSKIRFTPDAGGAQSYTIDNGNFAASQQEVINTSLTLIDGQTYAVEYQIFDAAGNCSCGSNNDSYAALQSKFIYDISKPTITSVSN